ncbi:MAG: hypothetical protein JW786_02225, partial [Desulfobacterales bacterium]|nr:hypothetical protein [Desulfobacterales bacterium]
MKLFFETWKDFFRSFKARSLAAKLSIASVVFVFSLIISLGLSDFWFSINSEVPSPKQLLLYSLIGLFPVILLLTLLVPVLIKEIKKIRLWYFLFPLVILIITFVYYQFQKIDFLLNTTVVITTDIPSKDEPICFYDIRDDAEQKILFYSDRSKKEYCGNYKGYPIRANKPLTVNYDGAFGGGYFPLVSYKGQLPAKMSLSVSSSLVPNISQNFDYTFTPASGNTLQITGSSQNF